MGNSDVYEARACFLSPLPLLCLRGPTDTSAPSESGWVSSITGHNSTSKLLFWVRSLTLVISVHTAPAHTASSLFGGHSPFILAPPLQHLQLPKSSKPIRSKEDRTPDEASLFFWTNGLMLAQETRGLCLFIGYCDRHKPLNLILTKVPGIPLGSMSWNKPAKALTSSKAPQGWKELDDARPEDLTTLCLKFFCAFFITASPMPTTPPGKY